jgi:hypothetical protein
VDVMSTNLASAAVGRCGCHEWHPVVAIDGWMVRRGGSELVPVPTWAETGGIWRPGHCELSHEELTRRIQAAGGIGCGYALEATTLLSGETELTNGLHRWVVATKLGIEGVPVRMRHETEPVWAWPATGDYYG